MFFVRSFSLAIVAIQLTSAYGLSPSHGDGEVTVTKTNTHYVCPCETGMHVMPMNPGQTGGWADWVASSLDPQGTTSLHKASSTSSRWTESVAALSTKTTHHSSSYADPTWTSSTRHWTTSSTTSSSSAALQTLSAIASPVTTTSATSTSSASTGASPPATTTSMTTSTMTTTSTATTTTFNACPTGNVYAIQDSADNNYASIVENGVGQYIISFEQPTIATAVQFSFVLSGDNTCSLVAPVAAPGLFSYVLDNNPGEFVDYHFVFLSNPTVATANGAVATPLDCTIDASNVLHCTVQDQNVLQLYGSFLSISAIDEGTGPATFTMVQIL